MPHLQGLFNNPNIEANRPNSSYFFLILYSHLCHDVPEGLFPVGLPVKILKALLRSSILATCPSYLNLLDLITLTMASLLPILILLGPKYSPQDPVFKYH